MSEIVNNNNGWTRWINRAKSILDRIAALEEAVAEGGGGGGQIPADLQQTLNALTAKDAEHDTRLNGIGTSVSGLSERVARMEGGLSTTQTDIQSETTRATQAEQALREAVAALQTWKQTIGDDSLDEKIAQINTAISDLQQGGYVEKIQRIETGLNSEVQTDRNAAIQAAITTAKHELEGIYVKASDMSDYATKQSVSESVATEESRAKQAEQELQAAIDNLPTTGGTPPDEEDITKAQEGDGEVLKFKDKEYAPENFSGLGRVYLRKNLVGDKNILTQAMVNKANTIYVIQYDYDMNGARIEMPDGCTLEFNGGSLTNGRLVGTNTKLTGCKDNCLDGVSFGGVFKDMTVEASWLGLIPNGDGTTAGTPNQQERFNKLSQLIACTRTITVNFRKGYYGYGGGAEGTGNMSDEGRRCSLTAIWYGYFAIELWDDYTTGGQSNGSRMHNVWPDAVLRTDNLIINGNGAYFLNVYEYLIGTWQVKNGKLVASNVTNVNTVPAPQQRTQNGGFIGIYTWKTLNLKVYNLTQDHNIEILKFGGAQYATQGQIGLYFETYGDLYVDGCTFKNNVTDGICSSTRSAIVNGSRLYLHPNIVSITNTTVDNCFRQGISITGGKNVLIDGCIIKNIGQIYEIGVDKGIPYRFESPWCAIDIEPIVEYGHVENTTIRNCKFFNINRMCIVSSHQRVDDITITDCYAENQKIAGSVRNRNDGFHTPCLSYQPINEKYYNIGFTTEMLKTLGNVYETDLTYNVGAVTYTRFATIISGKTLTIDNIKLLNVNYGYSYCLYPPDRSYRPSDFDASDTSRTWWWETKYDGIPAQIGSITAVYRPIANKNYKYYEFNLPSESSNYLLAYNTDLQAWAWTFQYLYWPLPPYTDHNDIHTFGRIEFASVNITVCKDFQFRGGSGHTISVIDNLNVYIAENLTGQLFVGGTTQYSMRINNLNLIDCSKDGVNTSVSTIIPDALAGCIKNIRVIDDNNNKGITFADTVDARVTSYDKTVRIPTYASYFVTDDDKADGSTHRNVYIGALNSRINSDSLIPAGTCYYGLTPDAFFNFDKAPSPTLFRVGIKGGGDWFAMPLKAFGSFSIASLSVLKSLLPGTYSKHLLAGETIYDRSRKQTIVGTGVTNEYLRWDGNPYGIPEHGNYADMYDLSESNGQNLRIGTLFTNTESKRLCQWKGDAWVDERFQTPAKRRGLSTERPGNAYSIKGGTEAPPTDMGWRVYVGYTYNQDGVIKIVQSIREPSITWVDEQTFANSHKPSDRSDVTVPSNVRRSGTTAQRPTAAYAYANLYIGFEYDDTTLGKYVYIETLTETTITWNERRKYRYWHLIPNQDEGYEYFDTTLGKPIYAKTLNNNGSVVWMDATGAIV